MSERPRSSCSIRVFSEHPVRDVHISGIANDFLGVPSFHRTQSPQPRIADPKHIMRQPSPITNTLTVGHTPDNWFDTRSGSRRSWRGLCSTNPLTSGYEHDNFRPTFKRAATEPFNHLTSNAVALCESAENRSGRRLDDSRSTLVRDPILCGDSPSTTAGRRTNLVAREQIPQKQWRSCVRSAPASRLPHGIPPRPFHRHLEPPPSDSDDMRHGRLHVQPLQPPRCPITVGDERPPPTTRSSNTFDLSAADQSRPSSVRLVNQRPNHTSVAPGSLISLTGQPAPTPRKIRVVPAVQSPKTANSAAAHPNSSCAFEAREKLRSSHERALWTAAAASTLSAAEEMRANRQKLRGCSDSFRDFLYDAKPPNCK
eukprot:gnl/Spiro4/11433_TR6037_c0_g1_i1.p1 gnl/Spiro4/11433_TR6037_c0_g1~~gnl/Spiro4/11433_TR6037_c0_g1_i1.p1  ORF type:complete len:379 (-),score=22.90 gnl/Spiro4/11433_TR6037_c0_g1_i1:57-1166(-)